MTDRTSKAQSHINIMWYRGTKDNFHYVSHVYAMFGRKDYKISTKELEIKDTFPLTPDSQKWMNISSISEKWKASRLDSETQIWIRENVGMKLK